DVQLDALVDAHGDVDEAGVALDGDGDEAGRGAEEAVLGVELVERLGLGLELAGGGGEGAAADELEALLQVRLEQGRGALVVDVAYDQRALHLEGHAKAAGHGLRPPSHLPKEARLLQADERGVEHLTADGRADAQIHDAAEA